MKKSLWVSVIFMIVCAALLATTFGTVERTCAVCGAKNNYPVIRTVSFNGYDLDMRPAGAPLLIVQQCPDCGYCAADVGNLINRAEETVMDSAYKAQLTNTEFPEKADKFLAKMMIEDKAGERKAAIRSAINAGWASDDAKMPSAAVAARNMSIRRIMELNALNERYSQGKGEDELLLADMYRRNGEFEKAEQLVKKGLEHTVGETFKAVLNFERELIENRDIAVHTIAEAEAKYLSITAREISRSIGLRVPDESEETIKIPVTVLYPDGRTAVQATLKFAPENERIAPSFFYYSSSFKEGKHHIIIPKGVPGKLIAGIIVNNTTLRHCPEKIDTFMGSTSTIFRSGEVLISGENNGYGDIRLNFSETPYCK